MTVSSKTRIGTEEQPTPKEDVSRAAVAPKKPVVKQSYEGNVDVQRWLQEQTPPEGGHKPPFEPTLLAGLRDRDWILSSLGHFYQEDLLDDVLHVVKSGKEATVYCCEAGPAVDLHYVAAKVYRPRMFRSLSNDAIYRESRSRYDQDGKIVRDGRRRGSGTKSGRIRASEVSSWISYEYRVQQLAHQAGANVPRPISQIGNAVLMEYIGDVDEPAPHLQQVQVPRARAGELFHSLMRDVEVFLACDCIHGDLSAYNILYWQEQVIVIDFAQAVDPRHNPDVYSLLYRDIERVYQYFARFGVVADPHEIAATLWSRYMGGDL
jgi:RIO kinase 1